jgi:two-component system, OmpR family, response regulator CpxR
MTDLPPNDERRAAVLLIDDDVDLCVLVFNFLGQHEFNVSVVHDGRLGLKAAVEKTFDLVILDVMLPQLNGFEVLAQLRKRSAVPVIMLTAKTEQADRVAGLDLGADDYLAKPFGPEELVSRMRAVLRRTRRGIDTPAGIRSGELSIDRRSRSASWKGDDLALTSVEFDILDVLVRASGRIVTRDELTIVLYQREANPFDRSLDVHISHLRQKLGREGNRMIRTIRGSGYMFAGDIG